MSGNISFSEDDLIKAHELYMTGLSGEDVSRIFHVSRSFIYRKFKENNLYIRKRETVDKISNKGKNCEEKAQLSQGEKDKLLCEIIELLFVLSPKFNPERDGWAIETYNKAVEYYWSALK